jgi:hypothetical protein
MNETDIYSQIDIGGDEFDARRSQFNLISETERNIDVAVRKTKNFVYLNLI